MHRGAKTHQLLCRRGGDAHGWKDGCVPNELDFLVVLDEHTRDSSLGCVPGWMELMSLARPLSERPHEEAARWTGTLVDLGYIRHQPKSMGDRRPEIPGTSWDQGEVSRYHDYRVTAAGREEAERIRRREREMATDAALGSRSAMLFRPWMTEAQRRAIAVPLAHLQSALDSQDNGGAIGAAKDLIESACRIAMEQGGQSTPSGMSLPSLFKLAAESGAPSDVSATGVGRGLVSTVQRLAELRNVAGSGHGRASTPGVAWRDAQLAAATSTAVASYVLTR